MDLTIIEATFIIMILLLILIVVLFACEKLNTPTLPTAVAVSNVKRELKSFFSTWFRKAPPLVERNRFDSYLLNQFRSILKPIMNTAFDVEHAVTLESNVPCIILRILPNRILLEEELEEYSAQLLLKFTTYLSNRLLTWPCFARYEISYKHIVFFIYYQELAEDKDSYDKRYNIYLRDSSVADYGILTDEDINNELRKI